MKKKIVCMLAAGMLVLTACGAQKPAEEAPVSPVTESEAEPAADETQESGESVGMANPWTEITQEDAMNYVPRLFVAPDGATNVEWHALDEGVEFPGPLIQLNFDLDGLYYCARAQYGASEEEDISGMYYDWTDTSDGTLAGWGYGEMPANFYRYEGKDECADLCTWYDYEIGIAYCLSTTAEDLDGFDIQAIVEAMYPGDEFMPSSFLEYDTQRNDFDSYEEIISLLQPGQGYAYVEVYGSDAKMLAISDEIFDYEGKKASQAFYLYGEGPDGIVNIGNAFTPEGCPIRMADGLVYCCSDDTYEADCVTKDGYGLMVKEYINKYTDDEGKTAYSGFVRKDNDLEDDGDLSDEDAAERFEQLQKDAEKAPVLEFTVAE